jgi:hypothetical protein
MADANVDIVIDCADPETDPGWIAMADPEGNEFCVCPGVPLPTAPSPHE